MKKIAHILSKALLGFACTGAGCSATSYPKSDHYDGTVFFNVDRDAQGSKSLFEVVKWKVKDKATPWPLQVVNIHVPVLPKEIAKTDVYITFINHATELIQIQGLHILTDPIFSERCSPFQWIGPKRVRAPALSLNELPKIDIVLISHNHYDHMDEGSLRQIDAMHHPLFIIPLGNRKLLQKMGIKNIVEMDWWEEHVINAEQSIIFTPAQHWSGRGLMDRCKSLWGSYLIRSNNLKIYFGGDSGYSSHFREIKERYGTIDVSMLPIGAYEPRWFMHKLHINPEEAVQAHLDLGSKFSMGMHFGTFALANEGIDDPVIALKKSAAMRGLGPEEFVAPLHGETLHYKQNIETGSL